MRPERCDWTLPFVFNNIRVRRPAYFFHASGRGGINNQSEGELKMDLIITLVIGGIIGWVASMVMKTNSQMGWIANVLVGIVGSFLGYWLAGLLGIAPTGGILRFVIAVVGAALLIYILSLLGLFKKA
jgi:uncharacterized membrane protein YeaQ/YmgE (transglycosylase-associated protein family)